MDSHDFTAVVPGELAGAASNGLCLPIPICGQFAEIGGFLAVLDFECHAPYGQSFYGRIAVGQQFILIVTNQTVFLLKLIDAGENIAG